MTINYTSLLGLAKPVTGTETGQWGDVVNNEITSLLEDAVANAATISVTAGNVTLSTTNGSSNQARMATLIITGTPGTTRNVVAPSQAKIYVVVNQSDSSVVIKGAATTGITVAAGQTAQVVWNGTDFVEVGNYVHGNFIVNGNLTVKGNTTLGDAAGDSLTVNATVTSNLIFTDNTYDIGASGATRPRTVYVGTSVVTPLLDVDNLRLDGNTLSSTDSNGNVVLSPNGTGDVQLDADTVRIGDSNANATITTNGTGDLILNTNAGTNSGSITIEDGVNGNIIIAPNGTGQVQITNASLDLTTIEVTNIKAKDGTASMTLADTTGNVTVSSAFAANGGVTIGDASGDAFTINSSAVSTPNGLNFDSNTLVIDAANDRVGVGTASPANKLHVNGAAENVHVILTNSTTGATISDGFQLICETGTANAYILQRENAPILFYTNNTEKMRLLGGTGTNLNIGGNFTSTNNTLQVTGNAAIGYTTAAPTTGLIVAGNVGIGTDSPAGRMHIAQTNAGGSQFLTLQTTNTTQGNAAIRWQGSAGTNQAFIASYFNNADTGNLEFGNGSTTNMLLNSSGNLGIGTSSPQSKLHILGNHSTANVQLSGNYSAGENNNNIGLKIQVAGYGSSGAWPTFGFAPDYGNGNFNLLFETVGNTYQFTSSATKILSATQSGNVGIGTSSPGYPLEVRKDQNAGTKLGVQNQNSGASALAGIDFQAYGGGWQIEVPASTTFVNPLRFSFNASEKMRLDFSGNLGIGTSSPVTSLHIVKDIGGAISGPTAVISLGGNSAYRAAVAGYQFNYADRMGLGLYYYGASGQQLGALLDASGNLGLGVTPSDWQTGGKFQVGAGQTIGSVGNGIVLASNWYYNTTNKFAGTGYASYYNQVDGVHSWHTSTTSGSIGNNAVLSQAMTLHASGGLSVGNTNDPSGGSVNIGVGAVNSNNYLLRISAGTSGLSRIIAADTSDSGYIDYNHSIDAWQFYTNSTERARITSGGNLLVQTDNSSTTAGVGVKINASATAPVVSVVGSASTNADPTYLLYSTGAAAYRFYVDFAGNINATNTTIAGISDQRLKENIRDLDVGLDAILALKPRKFDWKAGKGKDKKDDRGFIAQEFEQVFPDLVDKWLDPAPEGEEPYKSVRPDLIPVLVKAIQEQQAMINELKAEMAALKGA